MKKTILSTCIAIAAIANCNVLNAQSINYKIVGNDINTFRKLSVRPYASFFIPPTPIAEGFANGYIEAQYWLKNIVDIRAGFGVGTFTGFTGGGTFHLMDKIKSTKHKFVLSRTETRRTTTTNYFKAYADSRVVIGPCLDVSVGMLKNAGFFTKIDIGLDYQSFGRAYAETGNRTIASSKNGWVSLKVQGVIASLNWDDNKFDATKPTRKLGIGGQVSLSASARPWKGVTFYANLPMGAMKIQGVTEDAIQPILQINLGVSINLIKQ
jgi:hypothetical protein